MSDDDLLPKEIAAKCSDHDKDQSTINQSEKINKRCEDQNVYGNRRRDNKRRSCPEPWLPEGFGLRDLPCSAR